MAVRSTKETWSFSYRNKKLMTLRMKYFLQSHLDVGANE